jgi:glycerol-3-phosphate acyltransferase PlsY
LGVLIGYVFGCFTTGYYLVRWRTGDDIREIGSGSCGARNVGRLLGRNAFLLVVLGDVLKGVFAVALSQMLIGGERAKLFAMVAVAIGHIWPVQLKFRGGKGVATSLGALLTAAPALCGVYLIIFGIGYVATRKSVSSGLLAFALLPAASLFMSRSVDCTTAISVLASIILTAHYRNVIEEFNQLFARQPNVAVQPKAESTKP